jgi:hypothetical protein
MKNLSLLTIALLFFSAISCKLLEKTIQVKTTFSHTFSKSANDNTTINNSVTKDMKDKDVEANKNNLKELVVSKAGYTVTNFSGNNPVLSGELSFSSPSVSTPMVLGSFSNINLKGLADSGSETALPMANAAALQKLADAIKNGETVTFTVAGSTSEVPLTATLNVVIYSNLKVGI